MQTNAMLLCACLLHNGDMLNLHTLIGRLRHSKSRLLDNSRQCARPWAEDPLSHPALRNMTLEQLADLPFDRGHGATPPSGCQTGSKM